MDTIGNLIDRLCILEKRKEILEEDRAINHEVIDELEEQRGWIVADMGRITKAIRKGKHPGILKKNKIYDPDIKEEECNNLINLIFKLDLVTRKLWELEDKRRDSDNITPDDRLEACDQVSKYNKQRNNLIDRIDEVYVASLKKAKVNEDTYFGC